MYRKRELVTERDIDKFYEAGEKAPTVNFTGDVAPAPEGKTHRGFSDIVVKLTPNQEAIALKHDYLSRRAYNWAVEVGKFSSILRKSLKIRSEETGHWVPSVIKEGEKVDVTYTNSMGREYLADANKEEAEELFSLMKKFVWENASFYRKYWKGKPVKGSTVSPQKIHEVRANADANEEYKEEVNERAAAEQGRYASLFYAGLLNSISGTWDTELLELDNTLPKADAERQMETRKKIAQHLRGVNQNIIRRNGINKLLTIVQYTEVPEFSALYTLPSGASVRPNTRILNGSLSSATFAFERFYAASTKVGFPKRKKSSPSKKLRITSYDVDRNPVIMGKTPDHGSAKSFFHFPGLANEKGATQVHMASNYNRLQNFVNRYCTFAENPEHGQPRNAMSVSQCSLRFDGNQWWLSVSVGVVLQQDRKRNKHKNAHDVVGIDRGARGHNMITASKPVPRRDHHIRDEKGNLVRTVPIVHIGENGHDLMDIPDTPKVTRDRARVLKMQQDRSRRLAARKAQNDEHYSVCQKNHSIYHCDKRNCVELCANDVECQNYCDEILAPSVKEKKLTRDIARITSRLTRRNRSYKNQAASTVARMTKTVAIENLNTTGMLRAPKRKFAEDEEGNRILNEDGSNRYAKNSRNAKRTLAHNISKAGFGELAEKTIQHGETYDTNVAKVNQYFPSSQICSQCRYHNTKSSSESFVCENCNVRIDRDMNAATNIENNVRHHKQGGTWKVSKETETKE